jgi:hypothetical protein
MAIMVWRERLRVFANGMGRRSVEASMSNFAARPPSSGQHRQAARVAAGMISDAALVRYYRDCGLITEDVYLGWQR